jgi:phosphoglycerate dehydrogenase-like enzyme
MTLLAYDNEVGSDAIKALGGVLAQLGRLLRESDFTSLHVLLTAETKHLVDSGALRKMKPTAILVNTARADLIDDNALAEALEHDGLGGAALDVLKSEPMANDQLRRLNSS